MNEDNFARSMQLYGGLSFHLGASDDIGALIVAVLAGSVAGIRALRLRANGRLNKKLEQARARALFLRAFRNRSK